MECGQCRHRRSAGKAAAPAAAEPALCSAKCAKGSKKVGGEPAENCSLTMAKQTEGEVGVLRVRLRQEKENAGTKNSPAKGLHEA